MRLGRWFECGLVREHGRGARAFWVARKWLAVYVGPVWFEVRLLP